jgi:plastocyanin
MTREERVPNRSGLRGLALVMLLVLSLGLLVAGCGDDDDEADATDTVAQTATTGEATAEDGEVTQAFDVPVAQTGLAYAITEITASPGTITLRSANGQAIPHNIAIDEPEQQIGEIVQDGGVSEITLTITEPGEYEFYCSVPGHREAGMVGTLIIE